MSFIDAFEFNKAFKRFDKLGLELVGTNSDTGLYFVKDKIVKQK